MKILLPLIISFSTCVYGSTETYDVEMFCQDLNVILQKVSTHASNIANHQTTRTVQGGHYKRLIVKDCVDGKCDVKIDESEPILKYLPGHPDANAQGHVAFPSFSVHEEKALLIKAQNAYDLVIKSIPVSAKDLLIGDKFNNCFENYSYFKEQFDFQTYLGR